MLSCDRRLIRFLGTGASDWLLPHECTEMCRERCDRMKRSGGRNVRRPSSLFIAPDVLIDLTSQTVEALDAFGIDSKSIRAVMTTHGHSDHFQPLEMLGLAARLPHRLEVYGNSMVRDALEFAATHEWDPALERFVTVGEDRSGPRLNSIQMEVVTPGMKVDVGGLEVTPVLANHMIDKRHLILEQQALNFVVELDGRALFYGLDSSCVLSETFEALSEWRFDIAVFDATFGHFEINPYRSGHQNFVMLEKTIARFRQAGLFKEDAIIVASHISRCYVDPHDEIAGDLAERGVVLAYDGMTLEL